MNLVYPMFYKMYGIRRAQQMLSPTMRSLETFQFPRGAIFHFMSYDPEVVDPDPAKAYFNTNGRKIMVDIVDNLADNWGHPRRMNKPLMNLYRDFFRKHNVFKYMKDAYRFVHDSTALMVINYAYINELYKYSIMPMTDYYKWHNLEITLWDKLKEVTAKSERQNFIFIEIPKVLPSIQTLRMFENRLSNTMLKALDTPEKRLMLEFWKWADPNLSKNSLLGGLNAEALQAYKDSNPAAPEAELIKLAEFTPDQMSKINFIFTANGQWCCVNFGLMAKWHKDKTPNKADAHDVQLGHMQYQKFLLKFFIMVQSASLGQAEVEPEETPETAIDPDKEEGIIQPVDTEDDNEPDEVRPSQNVDMTTEKYTASIVTGKGPTMELAPKDKPDTETLGDGTIVFDDSLFDEIDKELQSLREIEARNMVVVNEAEDKTPKALSFEPQEGEREEISKQVLLEKSSVDELKHQINLQADYGLMSAKDYRTAITQAERYVKSKNPYTEDVSVEEFIKVPQEKLKINEEKSKIPVKVKIPDETMLHSSLMDFDREMSHEILPKLTVASVMNIQRAGVIIQDHQVEREISVLGEYESHMLKLKPIEGVPSIVHFRLPVVDKDGNFTANGNKYRLRKQRTDLPIRKINPFTVSLSSYYGKVSVLRSTKKVNDSTDWLCRQILGEGLRGDSLVIRKVAPANVFDNHFEAPKIYTGLAQHFKTIEFKDMTFTLDHNEREKIMPPDMLARLEGDKQYRLIGIHSTSNSTAGVFVNYDDEFFLYQDNTMRPIGTIYDICQVPLQKAPIDFAELKVYSKTISLGLVLGYLIGFSNLIKLLGVNPVVVDSNKRMTLAPTQWAMVFKDKKLIFSRENKLATMVLAGFNSYPAIRNFFLESFDSKNVYLNVLESQDVGARYIRELDMLDQLFVDPATKVILQQMKEPITFQGLLFRSSEMLMTDLHPDSGDIDFQRLRGYERFSGAVYKELVKSVREFKMRNIRGKSKIEMNPYAVWRNILEDPAKDLTREINPIQYLKEQEAVTYVGEGGRAKDSMNKKSRAYHPNDRGVISEANVGSGDVGINSYLSANPQFTSIMGMTKPLDIEKVGVTSLFSTSALAAPGSDRDDGKRIKVVSPLSE